MAKIDIGTNRLARFFEGSGNSTYLQKFIGREGIIRCNYGWYKTQGEIDTNLVPTSNNGDATFKVRSRDLVPATLMNLRAPLAEGHQKDKAGFKWYTASIPDFAADGFRETAMERYYKTKLLQDEFGNDADLVDAYLDKVQDLVDSLDSTMTFLTARLASTGQIDYDKIARGIQEPLYDANVPKANRKKAGSVAWTDANCDILEQMRKMEEDWRNAFPQYNSVPLLWQMTRNDYYNVFLKNKQVAELWQSWAKANYVAYLQNYGPNREMFLQSVTDLRGLSTIEVVEEQEQNMRFDGAVEVVHGWADGTVVLRPGGSAFKFMRKEIQDKRIFETLGNNLVNVNWAVTNDGLGLLRNMTTANGMYKEFKTDLFMASIPAMLDFPFRWIVDIKTKG